MSVWERFRDAVLTPARIVPLVGGVITAGVTALTGYLAANGFNLDPAIVTGIVVPIALGGLAAVLKWQNGWQDYEKRTEGVVERPPPYVTDPVTQPDPIFEDDDLPDVDEATVEDG